MTARRRDDGPRSRSGLAALISNIRWWSGCCPADALLIGDSAIEVGAEVGDEIRGRCLQEKAIAMTVYPLGDLPKSGAGRAR